MWKRPVYLFRLLQEVFSRLAAKIIVRVYAVLALISNIIVWVAPREIQDKYQFVLIAKQVPLWAWLLGLLLILLIAAIDGAYRGFSRRDRELVTQRLDLEGKLEDERQKSEEQRLKLEKEIETERAKNVRPELIGEIQDYDITTGPWDDIDSSGVRFKTLTVILKVNFVNVRQVPAPIRDFCLSAQIDDKTYIAPFAEEYDLCNYHEGASGQEYTKVINLAKRINTVAKQGISFDGYLEFTLNDVLARDRQQISVKLTLVITDRFGGEHPITKAQSMIRPSQRGAAGKVFRC